MHRFFIDPGAILADAVWLSKEEAHHARTVLRLHLGESVELLDGKNTIYTGTVLSISNKGIQIKIESARQAIHKGLDVTLALSLIKADRFEWAIEKAVELGVKEMIPLSAERSQIKLDKQKIKQKQIRWQEISRQACKQCGLAEIPLIHASTRFPELLNQFKRFDRVLIPHLQGNNPLPSKPLIGDASKILILIGPEGDFSSSEIDQAIKNGALSVSLGPLVLRSETAAIHLISILNFISINV